MIPKHTTHLHIKLAPALLEALKKRAEEEGKNCSEFVREMIRLHLKDDK